MPRRADPIVFALLLGAAPGCDRRDDERVRVEVHQLVHSEGETASAAAGRLVAFGRRALPLIEAAMHTANAPGRKNLILAMRRLGDVEAVPLLVHIAAYDADEEVRREAEWTLRGFAQGEDDRAEKARAGLRRVDEIRAAEQAG